jgi:hypothetical protein
MGWHKTDSSQEITKIIEHLISNGTQIKFYVEGENTAFTSRFIKINKEEALSKIGKGPELVIEKLVPAKGNALIQSSREVVAEFKVNQNVCRFSTKNIGISSTYPHYGFIMSFPGSLNVKEKRREERFAYDIPELVSVEFTIGKGPNKGKKYELKVVDSSTHGLGLLVTEEDFDLLESLELGDELKDMTFFAAWAMIKVDGTVRHKTKIETGKNKGLYILGIESAEILESCKPPKVHS